MKKIIRTNNLQKALEDYDALRGQTVSYVSVLPVSPNIRNCVYCKQSTTDVEDERNLTVGSLIENFAQETETENRFVIPATYTVTYTNTVVRGIEVSGNDAIMYEDDDFTVVLGTVFNLEDSYTFVVTTHVTEMAYFVGDIVNQELHPVVSFGVIAEVNKRIDVVERELDTKVDVSALVQLDTKIDNNYNILDNKIDNSYNVLDNKIDNNYNVLDAKIDNSYNVLDNKIDNEISNLAVNFTTDNLVANVATVNSASIDNAQVNNFDVSSIIANGSTGTDGQVLGKVNGNVEWFSPSLDTNDFEVNYLTVNNDANVNGDNFTHKGFDVTSMTVISEDSFNSLSLSARGSAFYMTTPNGNMYFHGVKFAPQGMVHEYAANVNLPNMASGKSTLTTSTLTFTRGTVTNSFVNGGSYNGIKSFTAFGGPTWDNSAPVGTQANDGNIITNATQGLYVTNASGMFSGCTNLEGCFLTDPSLVINAPENYDPMKYCNNMKNMFTGCSKFNQPITIPNSVRDMSYAFTNCTNFDQPITIPDYCNAVGALGGTKFTQNLYVPSDSNVSNLFGSGALSDIRIDTFTLQAGFSCKNVSRIGFDVSDYDTCVQCNNLVVSGDEWSTIGYGIPLYDRHLSNFINGNSISVGNSTPGTGMLINNVYLNCNIVGVDFTEDGDYYPCFPIVKVGEANNVHIYSKYSVNTTNAPVSITGSFDNYTRYLNFYISNYTEEQVNSIITQYLTTGWDFSGNVYDTTSRRNVHVDIHLGIGHDFTGHIINDL